MPPLYGWQQSPFFVLYFLYYKCYFKCAQKKCGTFFASIFWFLEVFDYLAIPKYKTSKAHTVTCERFALLVGMQFWNCRSFKKSRCRLKRFCLLCYVFIFYVIFKFFSVKSIFNIRISIFLFTNQIFCLKKVFVYS